MFKFAWKCQSQGVIWNLSIFRAQIKHTKNFSIKNFGAPKTPPPLKFFMFGLFPVFWFNEEKGGPKHKEFTGVRGPFGGGSGRGGFCPNSLCLCLFRGLNLWALGEPYIMRSLGLQLTYVFQGRRSLRCCFDSVSIWCIVFFSCPEAPRLRQTITVPGLDL